MTLQKRKISEVIIDLSLIWPQWNLHNKTTVDGSKSAKERLEALRNQEQLVQRRYDLIREIDDIIETKLDERNKNHEVRNLET